MLFAGVEVLLACEQALPSAARRLGPYFKIYLPDEVSEIARVPRPRANTFFVWTNQITVNDIYFLLYEAKVISLEAELSQVSVI